MVSLVSGFADTAVVGSFAGVGVELRAEYQAARRASVGVGILVGKSRTGADSRDPDAVEQCESRLGCKDHLGAPNWVLAGRVFTRVHPDLEQPNYAVLGSLGAGFADTGLAYATVYAGVLGATGEDGVLGSVELGLVGPRPQREGDALWTLSGAIGYARTPEP